MAPRMQNRLVRVLVPLTFLFALVAMVLGMVCLLRHKTTAFQRPEQTAVAQRSILPADDRPYQRRPNYPEKSLPISLPAQPDIYSPMPSLPNGLVVKPPSERAMETLQKFLEAKTLAERLPMLETKMNEEELAKTCLAGPLPQAFGISIDAVETTPVEQVADFYHSLNFGDGEGRKNPQTILIRIRGGGEPKVVVDPFLDTFGGRLAAYAKSPSEKSATFQVIVWPLASCYDKRVPNNEKKLTLKLLPQDNAREIALASFGKQSKIAEMLEDGTYSLSYGKAKACTVLLRWNAEDNPAMPYLEAISLTSLNWNP